MFRYVILAALFSLSFAACQAPEEDHKHGHSSDPNAATFFMTENPVPPDTAKRTTPDARAKDADGRPFGHDLLGKPLPAFGGELLSGETFNSDTLRQWTIIRLWGVWCHDSRNDAPFANALANAVAQDPALNFVTIHVPSSARRLSNADMFRKYGSLNAYFESEGFSFPTLIDTDASLRKALGVEWTPTYLVIAPDGIVRGFRTDLTVAGGEPVKDFLKDIAKLRATTPIELSQETALEIGPDGAGYLNAPTPFAIDSVAPLFPGLSLTTSAAPAFHLLNTAGITVYTIEPDWTLGRVATISTRHNGVKGPLGERVGIFKYEDLPEGKKANCVEAGEVKRPHIVCADSDSDPRFWRHFDKAQPQYLSKMVFELPAAE